jgi:hypothetical protein
MLPVATMTYLRGVLGSGNFAFFASRASLAVSMRPVASRV